MALRRAFGIVLRVNTRTSRGNRRARDQGQAGAAAQSRAPDVRNQRHAVR